MIQDKREFEVELVVTSLHRITTFSRNAEEAERDAEELLRDGDQGEVLSIEVEQADAWPVEEEFSDDNGDDEDGE